MASTVQTSRTDLGESRVRVDVQVASDALEREVASAAGKLGRDLRIPGFRKGKVPAQVVLRRMGREAVVDEAVRIAFPTWYEQAMSEAGIVAVGDPHVDLNELPEKGAPLSFSVEVAVRPEATLGEYKGLEVGRREPEVDRERLESELERLRDSLASLETVERPAALGDFAVVDFTGTVDGEPFEGGEARGFLLELGSNRLVEGFEEQLVGAVAGDERDVAVSFPEDYPVEALAGQDAVFATEVKEVKEKRLPELDDDFAAEAGGFDTVAELRTEIETRVRAADEQAVEAEYRETVVDAVVQGARIDVPHDLAHAKSHEMWEHTARRLRRQGIEPERYLEMAGKSEHDLIDEAMPEAERALKREAALAAVIAAEGIEVSDDELLEALREAGRQPGQAPPTDKDVRKALERARSQGRDDLIREDIAMRKAVDLLVEHARPISKQQAEARGKLWTPERERQEPAGELWTPGS